MAKEKANKEETATQKQHETVAEPAKKDVVEEPATTPANTAPAVLAAPTTPAVAPATTTAAPTQPSVVVQTNKSGGGCGKWLVCCFVVLVLCCACIFGSGYLAIFQAGNVVKFLTNSRQDTTMTRVTSAQAQNFDLDKYIKDHPPVDMHNGTYEITIPEDVLLKAMFQSPESSYVAEYSAIRIVPGSMKFQMDVGSIIKRNIDMNGGMNFLGMKVDTSNLQGIYLNLVLVMDSNKNLTIQSARMGDSIFDIGPLVRNNAKTNLTTDLGGDEIKSIEFVNGGVKMVLSTSTFPAEDLINIDLNTLSPVTY